MFKWLFGNTKPQKKSDIRGNEKYIPQLDTMRNREGLLKKIEDGPNGVFYISLHEGRGDVDYDHYYYGDDSIECAFIIKHYWDESAKIDTLCYFVETAYKYLVRNPNNKVENQKKIFKENVTYACSNYTASNVFKERVQYKFNVIVSFSEDWM